MRWLLKMFLRLLLTRIGTNKKRSGRTQNYIPVLMLNWTNSMFSKVVTLYDPQSKFLIYLIQSRQETKGLSRTQLNLTKVNTLFISSMVGASTSPFIGRLVGRSVCQKNVKKCQKLSKRGFETTNDCTILQQDYDSILECTIVHHRHKTSSFVLGSCNKKWYIHQYHRGS